MNESGDRDDLMLNLLKLGDASVPTAGKACIFTHGSFPASGTSSHKTGLSSLSEQLQDFCLLAPEPN